MIYLVLFALIAATIAQSNMSLTTKLDDIANDADRLSRDFADSHYKYTPKIRTRLVELILRLIPAELEIKREENPELQDKFDGVVLLLEKKMRINYEKIKERISDLLRRFLTPALAPFALVNAPSQDQLQQALLPFEQTTPTSVDVSFRPINRDVIGAGIDRTYLPTSTSNRFTNYQPEYLPIAPRTYRPIRPQLTYIPYSRQYPQEYGSSRPEQYYWATYQQPSPYSIYQTVQPSSSQWYYSQPLQSQSEPQRQQYYWAYPYGSVYGRNSGF